MPCSFYIIGCNGIMRLLLMLIGVKYIINERINIFLKHQKFSFMTYPLCLTTS